MTEPQKQLIKQIRNGLDSVDVWHNGNKHKDDVTTLDFTYLGKDEELLENKPKITMTIEW